MPRIVPGRFRAQPDGDFVVFLLGMRVNRLFAPRRTIPTFRAMLAMMRALESNPSHGYMGGERLLFWRGMGYLQYWRSFDDLERFAANPAEPHQPAWAWFNRVMRAGDAVGVWHETYHVRPGDYEVIYNNMPRFGLGRAASHIAIDRAHDRARDRLG